MLHGAPVACPSAGREVRRAVLRCHSPPRALRRRFVVGVRSSVGPPQSPHAGAQSSGLPRVCADPGLAAASPSRAPAPFLARSQRLPGRTYLLAPRRAAPRRPLGGSEKEGTGQGGSGGSWSAADRAPPAAGEGAGRVSVGRETETETAAGARPPPPLEPPLSRPRTLAAGRGNPRQGARGAGCRGGARRGRGGGEDPSPASGETLLHRGCFSTPGRTQAPLQGL